MTIPENLTRALLELRLRHFESTSSIRPTLTDWGRQLSGFGG